jgi:hypothetical protein
VKEMNDTGRFKELLENLAEQFDNVKLKIGDFETSVNNRTILDSVDVKEFISELINIINAQDLLKNEYHTLFADDEMSDSLTELDEKIKAFDEEIMRQKEFEEAKKVITRFSEISSDNAQCREFLAKYLQRLIEIDTQNTEINEYRCAVQPYEKFYELVKVNEISVRATEAQEIYSCFDGDIISNLIFGNYYIVSDNPTDEEKPFSENSSEEIDDVQYKENENDNIADDVSDKNETADNKTAFPFSTAPVDTPEKLQVISKKSDIPAVIHKTKKEKSKEIER